VAAVCVAGRPMKFTPAPDLDTFPVIGMVGAKSPPGARKNVPLRRRWRGRPFARVGRLPRSSKPILSSVAWPVNQVAQDFDLTVIAVRGWLVPSWLVQCPYWWRGRWGAQRPTKARPPLKEPCSVVPVPG
jgi:hypothetical protein